MTSTRAHSLADWVQIVTGLAIIVGLALVIVELQQAKRLARAQLGSTALLDSVADHRALMGENPAESVLKACLNPDELTDYDRLILQSYFTLHTLKAYRAKGLEDIGAFGANWEAGALYQYRIVASTEPGRTWLRELTETLPDQQLKAIALSALETTQPSECQQRLQGIAP